MVENLPYGGCVGGSSGNQRQIQPVNIVIEYLKFQGGTCRMVGMGLGVHGEILRIQEAEHISRPGQDGPVPVPILPKGSGSGQDYGGGSGRAS